VLETGDDVYTVVDGVRLDMRPGDVVLTPGWAWHGHANDGPQPGYWIDYLDVPLVHLLEPMFFEHWPTGLQATETTTPPAPWVFPWGETLAALDAAKPDEHGRIRTELGAPSLPTTATHMERIAAGTATTALRTTANQIVTAVEGRGRTTVGDRIFEWSRGDVMAIPSWHRFAHTAEADAVLFTVSDEPTLKKLDFFRLTADA
jgi:gentisate 1,2-dioxygenase